MALDSVLTFFALAISPAVAATFGCLIWFKRDPASQPSIVAAIPLGLSSIAILLAQSAVVLLATFQEIATHQRAGVRAVVAGLLKAQRPLIWGFVDLGVCLLILMLLSLSLRYSRDADTPPIHAFVSLTALIATAVVIAATFVMVYVQYGTVDLVMMVVDTHRNQEITAGYGAVSPAYIAARISSRLVATTFLSIALFCALIVAGAVSLFWRQKQNSRQAFATVLALGSVIGCGVSAMSELGFVDYLQHLH
jgi:hypothetical protein